MLILLRLSGNAYPLSFDVKQDIELSQGDWRNRKVLKTCFNVRKYFENDKK